MTENKSPKMTKTCSSNEQGNEVLPEEKVEIVDKQFVTGSSYFGQWKDEEMSGEGHYNFAAGAQYVGEFKEGHFDGNGALIYPKGQILKGKWERGQLKSWTYEFKDGLNFDQRWKYCKYPDRRFYRSTKDHLRAAGFELRTDAPRPRKIPKGCYDVGEGFYNPETRCIQSGQDEMSIIRIPTQKETEWFVENCRKAWDEPTGYKPDLNQFWTTGRKESVRHLMKTVPSSVHTIVTPSKIQWK